MFTDGDKITENDYGTIYNFFNEHFGKVRGCLIDNEPWVVGRDVAKALGYGDVNQAIRKHVDIEDKRGRRIDAPSGGGLQTAIFINEAGVYSLIFSSKLKSAKKFRKWVFKEVLPAIRSTGTYVDPNHYLIRRLCTDIRKYETSAIARLMRYGEVNGIELTEEHKNRIYAEITSYVNKVCGIPKGKRDFVNTVELINCIGCEARVAAIIDRGIEQKCSFYNILDCCYAFVSEYIMTCKHVIWHTSRKPFSVYLDEKDEFVSLTTKPNKLILSLNGVDHNIRTTTSLAG